MLNRVGKTDLFVSPIGLGTAPLGNLYHEITEKQAVETVHYALDNGVTLLDTAPLYGATLSEQRLGVALQGVPRDRFVLSTKVGRYRQENAPDRHSYSRENILKSLDESLKRLKIDYVDIVYVHDPDMGDSAKNVAEALSEGFPTLADLKRQGVIKAFGAGMNQWQMELEFARQIDIDCFLLAGRYTLLEQGALQALDSFKEKQISIFPGGVFNSGILATGPQDHAKYDYEDAPREIIDKVKRLDAVCRRHGVALKTAAVQFPRAHPAITSLILGAESPQQVADNLEMLKVPIPPQVWEDLRAEGLLDPAAPVPVA